MGRSTLHISHYLMQYTDSNLQLAIVISSIVQRKASLGLGNVLGSCISNVMGAFALGILVHQGTIHFDITAKIHSFALFIVSSMFILLAFADLPDVTKGILCIVGSSVYVVSICSAIYDHILNSTMAEDATEGTFEEVYAEEPGPLVTDHQQLHISIYPSVLQYHPHDTTPLLPNYANSIPGPPMTTDSEIVQKTKIPYHILLVLIGIASLCLSSYLVVHTGSSLATSLNISPTLIGITLISFSTTIPDKFIAIFSNWQRYTSVMTATTAGSNIFLLTLCLGIVLVSGREGDRHGLLEESVVTFEVWCVWGCSVVLMVSTWTGARSWMGGLLFGCYLAFLGVEFTLFRR